MNKLSKSSSYNIFYCLNVQFLGLMGAVQALLPHPERTRISDAPYPEGTLLTKIKKFKYLDRKNT